ncbi:MAG: hypothetical protein RL227_1685 [Pseudomonadota bacterium]|jgi:pyruvate dehydrogenase E2 component (dihydrolipoamide acetyltransferase)
MIGFKLPSLGADMDDGTLLEWKVAPGQAVHKGDVVAVVDTTKAAIDVECWEEGRVHELLTQPGEKISVGTVMAWLLAPGEEAPAPVPALPAVPAALLPAAASPAAAVQAPAPAPAAAPQAPAAPAPAAASVDHHADHHAAHHADRHAALRGAIASAMSRSKREIPHYYLAEPVPMQQALQWLAARNEGRPVTARLLPAVLVLKAVALALRQVPELNGHFVDGSFRPAAAAHLGVAFSLRQGGLVAPALHDVAAQPLGTLMAALADLVLRCRAGRLSSSELSDATLTLSNLGDTGVDSVFGVIHPPQVALVGVGRIAERPWVVGGAVQACPMLTCTLAADHRVSDGHRGALFLAAVRDLLQAPAQLDTPA